MKDTISATVVWDFSDDRMGFLPTPGASRPAGAMQVPSAAGSPTVYASDSLVVQFTAVAGDLTPPPPAPLTQQPQPDLGPTVSGYAVTSGQDLPPVLPGGLNHGT